MTVREEKMRRLVKGKRKNEETKERRMKKSWRIKEKRVASCEEKAVTVYKKKKKEREMKQQKRQKQKHGRRHTSPRSS